MKRTISQFRSLIKRVAVSLPEQELDGRAHRGGELGLGDLLLGADPAVDGAVAAEVEDGEGHEHEGQDGQGAQLLLPGLALGAAGVGHGRRN